MFIVKGNTASGGTVCGRVKYIERRDKPKKLADAPENEIIRFETALKRAEKQLSALSEGADGTLAQICEIHSMMLEDEDYKDTVLNYIKNEKFTAEYAVTKAGETFAKMFKDTGDEYMSARADDVIDISRRLSGCLADENGEYGDMILMAKDILPCDIMSKPIAAISCGGAYNSHAALLARSMGVPFIINADMEDMAAFDDRFAVVDADKGEIVFEPDEKIISELDIPKEAFDIKIPENLPFNLYVNINIPAEANGDLLSAAGGIGLFRTEFLYIGKENAPSENEQYMTYCEILKKAKGKPVMIRTADIGGDKMPGYFDFENEPNPALGLRGIRFSLARPDIFKTQLRAILRASVNGDAEVIYPMITSLKEFRRAKAILNDAAKELEKEGIPYKIPKQGIMIETPAAALLSDELAKEADFFSIGTNDLIQYTYAADRQNGSVSDVYNGDMSALFSLIKMTAQSARNCGIPVSVCGEMASDVRYIKALASIPVDSLSVSPGSFKKVIAFINDACIYPKKDI